MAELRHIERIFDSQANGRSSLDAKQIMVESDGDHLFAWKDNEGTPRYYTGAAQHYWNGAALTYLDNEFNDVTAFGDIYASEYIYHTGDTDTRLQFGDDAITVTVGGADFLTLTEDTTDTAVFGAGVAVTFNDTVLFDGGTQGYLFTSQGDAQAVQSRTTAKNASFELYSLDGDETDSVQFRTYAMGTPTQTTDVSFLRMGYQVASSAMMIKSEANNGGTLFPIRVETEGNDNQIHVAAVDGSVGFSVVPELWDSTVNAIQLGVAGFWASDAISAGAKENSFGINAYYDSVDGRWERSTTDYPQRIYQSSTNHFLFQGATTGSVDTEITWVTALGIAGTWGTGDVDINQDGIDYDFRIFDNTPAVFALFDVSARRFALGHATPDRLFHVEQTDASVDIAYLHRLTHEVSGNSTVGIGVGIEFENTFYGNEIGSKIYSIATGGVNGSEDFALKIESMVSGSSAVAAVFGSAAGGAMGMQLPWMGAGTLISDANGVITAGSPDIYGGSLYLHEGSETVDIITINVYEKITGLTTGALNNVTINSDAFNVGETGWYKVEWQFSGDSSGTNQDYEIDIFVNDVEQGDGSARNRFGTAADINSFSGTGIIDVTNTSHDIDLRIKCTTSASDIDMLHCNFNVTRLWST